MARKEIMGKHPPSCCGTNQVLTFLLSVVRKLKPDHTLALYHKYRTIKVLNLYFPQSHFSLQELAVQDAKMLTTSPVKQHEKHNKKNWQHPQKHMSWILTDPWVCWRRLFCSCKDGCGKGYFRRSLPPTTACCAVILLYSQVILLCSPTLCNRFLGILQGYSKKGTGKVVLRGQKSATQLIRITYRSTFC